MDIPRHGALEAVLRNDTFGARFDLGAHGLEEGRVAVHEAEGDADVGLDVAGAQGSAADVGDGGEAVFLVGEFLELDNDFGGACDGVSAAVHWVGVCMSVFTL